MSVPSSVPLLNHLGESKRDNSNTIDLDTDVKVKRTNGVVETVPLMEEFVNLIDRDHGHLTKQFNKSPATFQMDPKALGQVEGLPDKARDMLSSQAPVSDPRDLLANFAREGLGLQAEEDVSLACSRAFKDSVAYLSNGLKLKDICIAMSKYLNACKDQKLPRLKRRKIDDLIKEIKDSDLKDAELDHWLIDSEISTSLQIESKSFPQNLQLDPPGPMPKKLGDALKTANIQLKKGKRFFNLLQGPCGDLSPSWLLVGMIALPNVPDKNHLRGWGVQEDSLRYILTKKELADETCQWKKDLKLTGPKAPEIEFKRSIGLLVGSQRISFLGLSVGFTSYSRAGELGKDVMEAHKRITGQSMAVVGLGGWSGDIRGGSSGM
jgi:hypothetical protein